MDKVQNLTTESIESAPLAFQGIDNVHGGDGLAFGVLGVGDSIANHVLQEDLQNSTGLLVDEAGDTLHTSTAGKTTDSWLGNALDVIAEDFPVALGTSLPETLASLSTSRHVELIRCLKTEDELKLEPSNDVDISVVFGGGFYRESLFALIFGLPDLFVKWFHCGTTHAH